MTDERFERLKWEIYSNEDLFDDLDHPHQIMQELFEELNYLRSQNKETNALPVRSKN